MDRGGDGTNEASEEDYAFQLAEEADKCDPLRLSNNSDSGSNATCSAESIFSLMELADQEFPLTLDSADIDENHEPEAVPDHETGGQMSGEIVAFNQSLIVSFLAMACRRR